MYVYREVRLRELLGKMQRDFDRGTDVDNAREGRLKDFLKEMQDRSRSGVIKTDNPQDTFELDTSLPREDENNLVVADESSKRSLPLHC